MPPRQEAALPRGPVRRAPPLRPRARDRDVPRQEVAQALRAQGREEGRAGRAGRRRDGQGGEGEGEGRGVGEVQGAAGEEGEVGEEEEAEGGGGQRRGQVG